MGTITEIAQQILEEEYRPEEFTDMLKDPVSFKKFQKALLDAAEEGGFVAEDDMLENEQIPESVELPSGKTEIRALSAKGREALVAFLEERLAAIDPEGRWNPPTRKTLQRWARGTSAASYEHAIKVCFACGLNDIDAARFITAGNVSLRAFNPRSASETAYFLCLSLGRTYAEARGIIENYQREYPEFAEGSAEAADVHTIVLADALKESFGVGDMGGIEAVSEYLRANRGSFSGASRTVWNAYVECKARLCFDLIARNPQDYLKELEKWLVEVGDRLAASGVGTTVLLECMKAVREDSENDNELESLKASWNDFVVSFEGKKCPYKLVQGHSAKGALLSPEKIVNDSLGQGRRRKLHVKEGSDGTVKRERWAKAARESSLPWKSDGVKMLWFFEGFPCKKYIQDLDRSEGEEVSLTQARKAIVLFYFLSYSLRWIEHEDDPGSFGYDEFISKYNGLNAVLRDCQLALLYPADPCDLLVMKSIRVFDRKYGGGDYDPIEYFNTVVDKSFPE